MDKLKLIISFGVLVLITTVTWFFWQDFQKFLKSNDEVIAGLAAIAAVVIAVWGIVKWPFSKKKENKLRQEVKIVVKAKNDVVMRDKVTNNCTISSDLKDEGIGVGSNPSTSND